MNTLAALKDLGERYGRVFRAAWSMRRQLDTVPRLRHESEFLPAALALRDTPVHPAPRVAALLIITLLGGALMWACLGKVDVIATAPGKLIPSGNVKAVQAHDTAVVEAIHVEDGQRVRRGDPLVDLDATVAVADEATAQVSLSATRLELLRARAMLDAIDRGSPPQPKQLADVGSPSAVATERRVLAGEYADYATNLSKMTADIDQARASVEGIEQEIKKLGDMLPIERRKEEDYASLIAKGYVGRHDYYAEQQAVIQMERDLAGQQAKRLEALAALNAALQKKEAYVAEVRRTWLEKIHDDDQKAASLQQEIVKAQQQQRLMRLRAPVDGTVQNLAVHTVGGVVTPAEVLLNLVPDRGPMLIQAIIDNQDIGFVREGQNVVVKVETFPFTRYGTLQGVVEQVSNDAKQDDKLGLVFMARIALSRSEMQVEGRRIHLTPGMAVTAEIKTGRRRIISYLLSPLLQRTDESMHER